MNTSIRSHTILVCSNCINFLALRFIYGFSHSIEYFRKQFSVSNAIHICMQITLHADINQYETNRRNFFGFRISVETQKMNSMAFKKFYFLFVRLRRENWIQSVLHMAMPWWKTYYLLLVYALQKHSLAFNVQWSVDFVVAEIFVKILNQ